MGWGPAPLGVRWPPPAQGALWAPRVPLWGIIEGGGAPTLPPRPLQPTTCQAWPSKAGHGFDCGAWGPPVGGQPLVGRGPHAEQPLKTPIKAIAPPLTEWVIGPLRPLNGLADHL